MIFLRLFVLGRCTRKSFSQNGTSHTDQHRHDTINPFKSQLAPVYHIWICIYVNLFASIIFCVENDELINCTLCFLSYLSSSSFFFLFFRKKRMLSIINLYLFIPINAIIFPLMLKKKKKKKTYLRHRRCVPNTERISTTGDEFKIPNIFPPQEISSKYQRYLRHRRSV